MNDPIEAPLSKRKKRTFSLMTAIGLVAGLYDDALTADMLNFCRQHGILAIDIAVDRSLPQHNQRPHDSHPNALAHEQYAAKLHAFLMERLPD